MIVVYNFFRVASHPEAAVRAGLAGLRGESDIIVQRRAEMTGVVQFALQSLRANSPVGSEHDPHPGQYRDSHTIFINGNDVKDLSSWQPGEEIEISNPVPYAKILEIGDHRHRVPHHTYELAEQALQRKHGDIVLVELNYMPIRFAGAAARGRRRGSAGLDRQPALIIKSLNR
jgi:hypothetical protein